MKKNLSIILLSLALFTSCEKEIDLGYRSIEKLYVVEGHLTNEKTEVLITYTRDMEDSIKGHGIGGALVKVSGDDGSAEVLEYGEDGYYRSPSGLIGNPGTTYTMDVQVGDEEFTSHSTMYGQAKIESMTFQWQKFIDNRILFCVLEIQDIPDEENYYCYRMYRNGKIYRWNIFQDKGNEDQVIQKNVFCMDEETAKDNKREDWDDILYEDDEITMEVQTIDRRTYDYLYSLGLSEHTSSNPIDNFTGGCLGYFAAYSSTSRHTVFQYDEIQ